MIGYIIKIQIEVRESTDSDSIDLLFVLATALVSFISLMIGAYIFRAYWTDTNLSSDLIVSAVLILYGLAVVYLCYKEYSSSRKSRVK